MRRELKDFKDSVAFLNRVSNSSTDEQIAVGSDHLKWFHESGRKLAAAKVSDDEVENLARYMASVAVEVVNKDKFAGFYASANWQLYTPQARRYLESLVGEAVP